MDLILIIEVLEVEATRSMVDRTPLEDLLNQLVAITNLKTSRDKHQDKVGALE